MKQKDIGNAKSTKFSRISLELVKECGPMMSARMSIGCHRLHFTQSASRTFHKTSCRCRQIARKPWHFGVAVGIVSAAAHGAEVSVVLRSAGPGQVELKCATGTSPVSGTQAPSRSVPAAGTCQTHLLCRCICRRVTADLSHPPFTNNDRGSQTHSSAQ